MRSRDVSIFAAFVGVIIAIVTLGIVAAADMGRQSQFDRKVMGCVAAIEARNPSLDARADYQRGENRFFFNELNEWDSRRHAGGIVLRRNPRGGVLKGCSHEYTNMWRDLPFDDFSRYMLVRHRDPFMGSVDPIYSPRTACGRANEQYIRAYNAEMARISPGSIKEYCD